MPSVKLSDRERNLLIVTVGFVIFYLFYQFLLTPVWKEIGKLKDSAREKRLELKVAEGKIRILQAIEKEVGIIPIRTEIPREEKALEALKIISQATAKSGLNISFIKPLLEEGGDGIKFDLSCSGKYKNLYNFLSILFRLRVLVMIDSMDITSSGGSSPTLDLKISLTTYY
ncbi:MAG: type 4a pilus biogenesis protein PilO [Candidatus Margulisbacteria bacterium]|nr:type 4a pilus biogenesis protein PilO [Candidatus Margulisiibacteriota bacterium]